MSQFPILHHLPLFLQYRRLLLLLATGPRQRGPDQLGIPTQLDTDGTFDLGEQGDVGDGSAGFVVGDLAVAKKGRHRSKEEIIHVLSAPGLRDETLEGAGRRVRRGDEDSRLTTLGFSLILVAKSF